MKGLGLDSYTDLDSANLNTIQQFISRWSASMQRKGNKLRKTKTKDLLTDTSKVTPDHINTYITSSRAGLAIKYLKVDFDVQRSTLTSTVHTLIRNFLTMNVTFSNWS